MGTQAKNIATIKGKTLEEAGPVAHVADIVYHGEKLILPEGMGLDDAMELLQSRKDYLEQEVIIRETFDVFPWDGAYLLNRVLARKFGWANSVATPGFWMDHPPELVTIEDGPNSKTQVPWGAFALQGISGLLHAAAEKKKGRMCFMATAKITRKDEATMRSIFVEMRAEAQLHSLYRGKAIKIRFRNEDGSMLKMPEPSFIDTDSVDPKGLIFSDDVMGAMQTNLFTPIERVADCIANKLPVKRGVLLGGVFGTGKTLAAAVASRLAVDNGVTYVYVPRADELADAIEFAKQYQSPACVVFCEDVDRVLDGERDVEMDDILNIIDGIDTKTSNVIVVLTTNELQKINAAMLRPGRLDAVIDVTPPDGPAVEKLLRHYGGDAIEPGTNLLEAGKLLAGNIPAVIAEVVKRAKLSQLRFQEKGKPVRNLSEAAIVDAAKSMAMHQRLLKERSEAVGAGPTLDLTMESLVQRTVDANMIGLNKKMDAVMGRFGVVLEDD